MASAGPDPTRNRPRRRTRRVSTALAQVPAVAAIVARHLGRDPWKAASVGLRAAPRPLRDLFRSPRARGRAPILAVVADAAAGRREEAVAALEAIITAGAPSQLRRAAAVSAVLDRPDLSAALVARLPEGDRARLRLAALTAWSDGDLSEAVNLASQVTRSRRGSMADGFRGEIALLQAAAVHRLPERGAPPTRSTPSRQARDAGPEDITVLHVVTNALPEVQAGYTIRTQGIAAGQRAAGMNAHVVTRLGFPVDTGRFTRSADFVHQGVPTHRLLPLGGVPLRADARLELGAHHLVRLAKEIDARLLHAHSKHDNGQLALLAGDKLGLPVVYEARGFLEETWRSRGGDADTDYYRLSREAETACMRTADAVVTVSEPMRADIVERGIPAGKVTVVGNAVPADYLGPVPDASGLRSELGIAAEAVAVGLVSTLNDYEGVDVLLEAIALVDDPRLVALVVGDGPARRDLERLAARLLPRGRFFFTGRVPHSAARAHHAALDVFCVPRRRTPVTALVPPLKPVEAMATARPVVVSDLPPLVELVGDLAGGRTDAVAAAQEAVALHVRGLVATPDDPASWAGALRVLLYDPALRAHMGHAARRWVSEHRTWDAAARTYADLYARVLNIAGPDPSENEGAVRAS
jgi:glycosyltransferase involved in cell wall biosynthesis